MSEKPKGGLITFVSQGWLILLLSIVFGCALAGVELALKDRILANKLGKTKGKISTYFESADLEFCKETELTAEDGKVIKVWKVVDENQNILGWLLPGKGSGYADTIELIVAVDASCDVILGMSVLSQKETPALGDKITKPEFQSNFTQGLKTDRDVVVVKGGGASPEKNEIDAIVGATVSSQSVASIVNATIAQLKPLILKQGMN